ncbi:hypothetical protein P7K49_015587 [Saguinus oedipus]|uniref:Uncharacterized protein n=1 Tax=Saguinus oedipus TaxID=9490 RepID=A0ABQ9VBP6_SAGOE|nr:hypothetical protein P7K49_015587 [Saguinus oedipus]
MGQKKEWQRQRTETGKGKQQIREKEITDTDGIQEAFQSGNEQSSVLVPRQAFRCHIDTLEAESARPNPTQPIVTTQAHTNPKYDLIGIYVNAQHENASSEKLQTSAGADTRPTKRKTNCSPSSQDAEGRDSSEPHKTTAGTLAVETEQDKL